jgi:rare lipoprotein A
VEFVKLSSLPSILLSFHRRRGGWLLGLLLASGTQGALAETAAQPDQQPAVHTAWAASVRKALAERVHHAEAAGRAALVWTEHGVASWYGKRLKGHRTSSGASLDPSALTAAHPTLPMGSKVLVTSEDTGRSVIVTINDRGPFNSRIIDLSHEAAAQIGMIGAGTAKVKIAPLPDGTDHATPLEVAEADPADSTDDSLAAATPDTPRKPAHPVRRAPSHRSIHKKVR